MSLESVTAEYMRQLDRVSPFFTYAAVSRAGLLDTYFNGIISLFEAQNGGFMFGEAAGSLALTAVLPIVTLVGVWVALGSGYSQAREEAKNKNTFSGFSQGFAAAILQWRWVHVVPRFQRPFLNINTMDEAMNSIRVNSYHTGLKTGFLAGLAMPNQAKRGYVHKIRQGGDVHAPKDWSNNEDTARNQQIAYVIDLATSAVRLQIIRPF